MDRFNGVATKYISNYMYWFKWPQLFGNDKGVVKYTGSAIKKM